MAALGSSGFARYKLTFLSYKLTFLSLGPGLGWDVHADEVTPCLEERCDYRPYHAVAHLMAVAARTMLCVRHDDVM